MSDSKGDNKTLEVILFFIVVVRYEARNYGK